MDLTDDERDLILAGLFELTITHVEDDEKRPMQGARVEDRRRPGGGVLRGQVASGSELLVGAEMIARGVLDRVRKCGTYIGAVEVLRTNRRQVRQCDGG